METDLIDDFFETEGVTVGGSGVAVPSSGAVRHGKFWLGSG